MSFFKYAYEAIIVNELASATITDEISGAKVVIPTSIVLTKFGFALNSFSRDVFISFGLVVALVLILSILVVFRLRERR